mgnify:CR=1 FL=1
MPKCQRRGNEVSFVSSRIPNITPWANGVFSALTGQFEGVGLSYVENLGVHNELSQRAFENPRQYFDTCAICGSTKVIWP